MDDELYMEHALKLAVKGIGNVNPNPLVGSVIVKDGKIIGEGYHKKYGDLHAERNALANCIVSPYGATMYVTLEPCCHYGKTPPCTKAIIENRISKVVVGTLDPNEKIIGKGVEILRKAGIEVVVGVLEEKCKTINEVFFHYITKKTPYVVMKYAMTMDGKISTVTGESKWITGEKARKKVHQDRTRYTAIMVGIGTVLADNPMLDSHSENGKNPIRIICDSNLRTPIESNVVKTAKFIRTIIVTTNTDINTQKAYVDNNCEVLVIPPKDKVIDLQKLMVKLGEMSIDSILLEGGSALNFSALESGIVHKVQCYIAPKLFGGGISKSPVGGKGFSEISNVLKLKNSIITQIDQDILIESEVDYSCLQE